MSQLRSIKQTHPELYHEIKYGPLTLDDARNLLRVTPGTRAQAITMILSKQARSAREAIEHLYTLTGKPMPDDIFVKPHREVLIDELRRVIIDAVAKQEDGNDTGAAHDMRRAEAIARKITE